MLDSLATLRHGARSWLGSLDSAHDFNPLLQTASGVYLTSFGSFVFGTPSFRLSDVPLRLIAADAATGRLDVKSVRVFRSTKSARRTASLKPTRVAESSTTSISATR
jgi:NADPH:quinone reductase